MTRWPRGEADVEDLLALNHLQRVRGGEQTAQRLLLKARQTHMTACAILEEDPENAFTLAYDAARYSGTALLAQQGLRPTSAGGHYAVEQALRAQFGPGFRDFGSLRRRRNELEYPSFEVGPATPEEAKSAIEEAGRLIEAAEKLVGTLGLFT